MSRVFYSFLTILVGIIFATIGAFTSDGCLDTTFSGICIIIFLCCLIGVPIYWANLESNYGNIPLAHIDEYIETAKRFNSPSISFDYEMPSIYKVLNSRRKYYKDEGYKIKGISKYQDNCKQIFDGGLGAGYTFEGIAIWEQTNSYDDYAIAVYAHIKHTDSYLKLGYMSRDVKNKKKIVEDMVECNNNDGGVKITGTLEYGKNMDTYYGAFWFD